jgi:hypothetical protein
MIDLHSESKPENLIRNCEFKFKCPKRWEDLETAASPRSIDLTRRCNECNQLVWKVDTEEQLAKYILRDYCVAITPELYDRTITDQNRQMIRASSGRLLGSYRLSE